MSQVRYSQPPQILGRTASDKLPPLVQLDDGTWTELTKEVMVERLKKWTQRFEEQAAIIEQLTARTVSLEQQVEAFAAQHYRGQKLQLLLTECKCLIVRCCELMV